MIYSTQGNILTSSSECIVIPVNCEQIMGKGLAYQSKSLFPSNYEIYKTTPLKIGVILFTKENNHIIANFPTKDKWRSPSSYSIIEQGLLTLKKELPLQNIKSIAIPPLGCGNGGLDYTKVKELITSILGPLNIDIYLYETPTNKTTTKNNITPLNVNHLILMKIKINLTSFNNLRLYSSVFFINLFNTHPFTPNIEQLSKDIKHYQAHYKIDTKEAESLLYSTIVSKQVNDTLDKYTYSITQATTFLNSITKDHTLSLVSHILNSIKENIKLNITDETLSIITNLIFSNILEKNNNTLTLSRSITNKEKVLYKYHIHTIKD